MKKETKHQSVEEFDVNSELNTVEDSLSDEDDYSIGRWTREE